MQGRCNTVWRSKLTMVVCIHETHHIHFSYWKTLKKKIFHLQILDLNLTMKLTSLQEKVSHQAVFIHGSVIWMNRYVG